MKKNIGGNIKRNKGRKKTAEFLGNSDVLVEVRGICMIDSLNYFFSR